MKWYWYKYKVQALGNKYLGSTGRGRGRWATILHHKLEVLSIRTTYSRKSPVSKITEVFSTVPGELPRITNMIQ